MGMAGITKAEFKMELGAVMAIQLLAQRRAVSTVLLFMMSHPKSRGKASTWLEEGDSREATYIDRETLGTSPIEKMQLTQKARL